MNVELVKKSITREVDGEEKTFVNLFLRVDNIGDIQIRSSFSNDSQLLKRLARKIDD